MIKFYKIMFFSMMIMGSLISISTLSWFTIWVGLEINLLSILPLMKNNNNKYFSEATIKYFMVQAMASSLFLFSILIYTSSSNMGILNINNYTSIITQSSLLLKMGAAPFHFWFPEVMSGLNWTMAMIMLTWQKLPPMMILNYTSKIPIFMILIILTCSIIGGIQGLNQMNLRKLLAFSSINHMGWMLASLFFSLNIWFLYFIIYVFLNISIIHFFKLNNLNFINQLNKIFSFNKKKKFFFMMNFLSLGGLPPFIGFLPKWLTINFLMYNNFYMLMFSLSILTLITLFFYLRLTLSSFSLNTKESLLTYTHNKNYMYMLNSFNILGLILTPSLTNMF